MVLYRQGEIFCPLCLPKKHYILYFPYKKEPIPPFSKIYFSFFKQNSPFPLDEKAKTM